MKKPRKNDEKPRTNYDKLGLMFATGAKVPGNESCTLPDLLGITFSNILYTSESKITTLAVSTKF